MPFVLGPNALAAGYRLFAHDAIGSTSEEALTLARGGDAGQVWVVAREQTAGRGRRGRAWYTSAGNLAASVYVRTSAPLTRAATLGFVGGLALHAALGEIAPAVAGVGEPSRGHRLRLKWPNDLVTEEGAKVAGILLQAVDLGPAKLGVVIGIGVNIVSAPADLGVPATSLSALGVRATAEDVFAELAEAWVSFERNWEGGRGIEATRALWLERATGVGGRVSVRTAGGDVSGVFETIDDEGRLVVRTPDGTLKRVAAGEVHFGGAASLRAG